MLARARVIEALTLLWTAGVSSRRMGRRQRRRQRESGPEPPAATTDYRDAEGNVLTLRDEVSRGTVERYRSLESRPGASLEDLEQRRIEFLFERLAVRWEIAGLPLEGQAELLGRYRMADPDLRQWVRDALAKHAASRLPELGPV
jgi:hypothetical protein